MHHFLLKRMFPRLFLVHLDSEPRSLRGKPIAVFGVERTPHHVPAPRDIHQHVFLNQKVWRRKRELEGDGIGNWPERVMRGNAHLVGLCHGGDFFRFHDSSTVAEIGLDHVAGSLLENGSELMARHESFTGGDRNSDGLSDLQERFHVFRRDGFFAEVRKIFFDRLDVLNSHGRVSPAVKIDHHIDRVTDCLA
jgi:hypothetical protein